MPVEHGFRPRLLPNLEPHGVGGSSGNGEPRGRPISLIQEISVWQKGTLGHNPSMRVWAVIDDVHERIKAYGDRASEDTAWRVKWAYLFLVQPFDVDEQARKSAWAAALPEQFEQFKEEQRYRGEDTPFLELTTFTQVKTLQFALDLAEVPVLANDVPFHLSLAPIEKEVEGIVFARRAEKKQTEKETQAALAQSYVTETGKILRVIPNGEDSTIQSEETTEPQKNNVIDFEAAKRRRRQT